MRTGGRRSPSVRDLLFLVAVPVLAVSAVLWLSRSSEHEPYMAQVIDSTVQQTEQGFFGNVTWIDDEGVRRVRRVEMTTAHVDSGSVPLTVTEGEVRIFVPPDQPVSTPVLLLTAAVGLLFAVVVLATLRGFGYVRGTGRSGEMTPDEVRESHAFYWRH